MYRVKSAILQLIKGEADIFFISNKMFTSYAFEKAGDYG